MSGVSVRADHGARDDLVADVDRDVGHVEVSRVTAIGVFDDHDVARAVVARSGTGAERVRFDDRAGAGCTERRADGQSKVNRWSGVVISVLAESVESGIPFCAPDFSLTDERNSGRGDVWIWGAVLSLDERRRGQKSGDEHSRQHGQYVAGSVKRQVLIPWFRDAGDPVGPSWS